MTTAALAERRLPPGPRPRHLLGVLPWIRRDSLGFLRENFARYGDVTGYRLGPLRSALIVHPDGVRHVLQEHVKNYTKDHASYTMVRWIAGDGLLTNQGESWLRQRRLAQPAFHRQRVSAMGEMMVRHSEGVLDEWEEAATAGQPVDVGAAMARLALRIVGDALFGARVDTQAETIGRSFTTLSEQLVLRFRTGNVLPPVLPTRRDREWRRALAALDALIYAMIAERRRGGEDRGDLFSMFLLARDEETGASMSDKHLRDELLTMLFAGHETTATALTWTWALLDANPAAAARLHAELDTVLGERSPTVADLPRLAYTRMVIDEALRLYPPAWIMARGVKDNDSIGGYAIPKGSAVDISPYMTHRHPAFWPDPERFDPERFTPEQQAARHKYAYIPFSTGPRICIGNTFALMEATLALATIARRVRLRLTGPLPEPEPLITLRPRGGLQMLTERR
ncbi:MAG TPA: cytochrome P450 [Chloroflexaceae bacterium]|nr:cytochrome P450 [Chloroflexaceae bacterium]